MLTRSFPGSSLDDVMRDVITMLLTSGEATTPSRGQAVEIRGATLELDNPRARLSRSETRGRVFSSLAELCWYLSGSDKVEPIKHYLSHYEDDAEEDGTVHGAYGPRLLNFDGIDQIRYVIDTLGQRPFSRQATIQIFDHEDVRELYNHVPCTCVLQYFVRSDSVDAITYMRSNDAYKGLPHDIFAFTMIQELIARSLGIDVGTYTHMVGSLHLYQADEANLENSSGPGKLTANGRVVATGRHRRRPVVLGRVDPEVRALVRFHALGMFTVVGSGAGTQVVKERWSAAAKRPA